MRPSEEIKQSCCGSLLECKKALIERVEDIERSLEIKNHEVQYLKNKIMELEGELLLIKKESKR